MNYNGLNEIQAQNVILKNSIKLEGLYRKYYIDRVRTLNQDSFNANPAPYRFYYESNCSILVLIFPEEFNMKNDLKVHFLSTPGKRQVNTYVVNEEDLQNLDSYRYESSYIFEKILPKFGYNSSQVLFQEEQRIKKDIYKKLSNVSYDIEYIASIHETSIRTETINRIREDIQEYKEIDQTPVSYFAQNATQFPFSIIDLNPLMEIVDDLDFTYQLEQAMAAYRQNLFLPSAAALGVCLETVCSKICEEHSINVKNSDTQLGKLMKLLYEDPNTRIITRRDNGRLEVAYKMRNLASHSSPGAVLKGDCHFMLEVIADISYKYLKRIK